MGERSPHIPGASGCQGGWAPFPCPLCGCCPGVGHSAAPAGPGGSLPSEIASAIALNKEFPKPRELLAEVCSPLAQAASQGWTGYPCQGDPLKTRTWGKHLTGQTPRWANTSLGKHLSPALLRDWKMPVPPPPPSRGDPLKLLERGGQEPGEAGQVQGWGWHMGTGRSCAGREQRVRVTVTWQSVPGVLEQDGSCCDRQQSHKTTLK